MQHMVHNNYTPCNPVSLVVISIVFVEMVLLDAQRYPVHQEVHESA